MASFFDLLFGPPKPAKLAPMPAAAKPPAGGKDVRAQVLKQVREASAKVMTPERAELIRKAMEVHKAKQTILADLSDEQRQRLVALALKKLLNEGRE